MKKPDLDDEAEKIEAALERVERILRHQKNVREAGERMAIKIIKSGNIELGVGLLANIQIHDNSKLRGIEFEELHPLTKEEMSDKEGLSKAVAHHQLINAHHVEYWGNIDEMPKIYLAEMACDLYARATEFGTDLRAFIKDRFLPKNNITTSSKAYKILKEYVDLLLDPEFKPLK